MQNETLEQLQPKLGFLLKGHDVDCDTPGWDSASLKTVEAKVDAEDDTEQCPANGDRQQDDPGQTNPRLRGKTTSPRQNRPRHPTVTQTLHRPPRVPSFHRQSRAVQPVKSGQVTASQNTPVGLKSAHALLAVDMAHALTRFAVQASV